MGYHPETLAFSFPPYPGRKGGRLAKLLYRAEPVIGVAVWHIDPERAGTENRTDDSCGWFDRTPGEYSVAVAEFIRDTSDMHDVGLTLARRKHMPMPFYEGISKPRTDADRADGYARLSQADTLAVVLMVARQLERARWWKLRYPAPWWRKPFIRERDVSREAFGLALNSGDNLSSVDNAESMVKLIAAALNRLFRPWWKHPRWHVHHWQVNVSLWRNIRRATVERCGTCKRPIGFNVCPTNPGDGSHHHGKCLGHASAPAA